MAKSTRVCYLEYRVEKTLTLLKAEEINAENIILLKHQKKAITPALNCEIVVILLPSSLRKSWICQVLPFIIS